MQFTRTHPARPRAGVVKDLLSRGVARVLHYGAWKFRYYECAWACVAKELASTVRAPWRVRPGLWRRGFLSESWVLYDLGTNDRRQYLSDYARFTRTRLINGGYSAVLDNKLVFDRFVGVAAPVLPRLHGVLHKGRLLDPMGDPPERRAADVVLDELRRAGALVLKPMTGGGGRGIAMLRHDEAGYRHNGAPVDEAALRRYVDGCENAMACEFVPQHPVLARLYPHTTNTLRLLTLQDDETEAFAAAAVLRLGTDTSAPTDNWSRGGLSARIDPASGRVGPAAAYPAHGDRLRWHAAHPSSGQAIDGTAIPHWERVLSGVLDVFRALPMLKYVGWDVVVTEDGFRILEGNNYSDVNLLQVHRPLLADPRTRAFYQRHRVL